MSTKLSFLSRAAVVAGIVAVSGLPALAQGTQTTVPPAAGATATAPVANQNSGKVEDKGHKAKAHTAKKHAKLVKTAKSDTGRKPAPAKAAEPANTNTSK